jgi:hemoglobin
MSDAEQSLYDRVGGTDVFVRLVDRFYDGVITDPVLVPLYPPDDIAGARERLTLFLVQYWGGPTTYSDERGHPRLRMRHAPFVIGERERQAWYRHMSAAVGQMVTEGAFDGDDALRMLEYFQMAAQHMINAPA